MKLFMSIILLLFVHPAFGDELISVVHGKYGDYYHITFKIDPTNTVLQIEGREQSDDWSSRDDGLFEIYIKSSAFPIQSRKCKHYIIARMPGTLGSSTLDREYINEKRDLYKHISKVINSTDGTIDVVLELNPYVEVAQKKPLSLELTQCNVFFRTSKGRYISYTGHIR